MKTKLKKLVSAALSLVIVLSSVLVLGSGVSASATECEEYESVGVMVDSSYDAGMQSDGIIDDESSVGSSDDNPDEPVIEPSEDETEPATTEPVTTQPVTTEPVTTEPVTTQPATTVSPKLSLNISSLTLGVNETYTLTAKIEGISSSDISWSSSSSSVVSVSKSGSSATVTAKKTGTATITAKANGVSAACKITVKNAPSKISLNKTSLTLGVGETYDLNSSLPSGTASHSIVYSSNNTSVATVKSAGGLVTAKATGTATITAKTYNGKTVTCKITVKNAPSSVSLNKTSLALAVGKTYDLNSSLPSGTASYSIVYSSSNSNIATVKASGGLVTAKSEGTATITAKTYNGKTATCTVTVKKVGTVKNIKKTSTESTSVTLKWDKVSGATGYVIYYLNADKHKNYSKVKEVKTNSATITGLKKTTQYYFKVAAYVEKNGVKYEGEATIKKTCTQAADVTNLTLKRSSDVIELSWSKVTNATGYKIYRASSSTNWSYKAYKTLKGNSATTLTDKSVSKGNQYRYKVVAYRQLYGDCYYYAKGVTKVTYAGLGAPNINVVSRLSKVNLTWSKNKYATGYEIYYSKNNKNNFTKLATTKNTYYNTSRLEVGKTYYFRVRAYRTLTVNGKKTNVPGTYYTYSVKISSGAYGQSIGNTYIEISIKEQRMWFYKNGKYVLDTYVVTGNDDGYHNTPTGVYSIWQRQSPATLVGSDYSTKVTYWLAFTYSGCGIHDSTWRSSSEYGGTTYKGNGSHGCVNTPYDKVKTIYQNVGIGTKVILY